MVYNKLPQGWVECEFKDIGEIVTGSTPSTKHPEYYGDDYPFYKPTDLNYGYFVETAKDTISTKGYEISRKLPAKSVLVTCIGATIGKTGLIRNEGICNQQINAVLPNKHISSEFVYFYAISSKIQNQIKINASATTLPILNKSGFEKLMFLLPPLNEQKRIVEKIEEEFGKIDEGIEKLKLAQEQIKQYRQSVLKSAFDGKLYKTTEWEEKIFSQVLEVNPKTDIPDIKDDDLVSFLPMPAVQAEINIYNEELVKYSKVKKGYTKFKNKDVLFAKITPSMENGKSCVVDNLKFGIGFGSTEFHILRNLGSILPEFVFYFVVQESFRKKAQNVMTGAVGQRRVPADYLKNININLPTLDEQKQIVAEIEKRFEVANKIERVISENLEKAEQLKQSILKKAFEGRLVPQDPNDEPASELLAKIQAERKK